MRPLGPTLAWIATYTWDKKPELHLSRLAFAGNKYVVIRYKSKISSGLIFVLTVIEKTNGEFYQMYLLTS